MEARDQVIGLIYEAAANPALWPAALECLAGATQSVGAHLIAFDKPSIEPRFGFVSGFAPDAMRLYTDHFSRIDPLISVIAGPVNERAMLCHEHVPQASVAGSEYYQDFLIPNQGRYMSGWNLESSPHQVTVLGLHKRSARFERRDLDVWEPVMRHARRAVSLSNRLMSRLAKGELLRQAIDHHAMTCIMVSSNGRVLDCSAAATALLENGGMLAVRGNSRLATNSAAATKELYSLIRNAAEGRGGGMMRIADVEQSGYWVLQIVPSGVAADNSFDPRFAHCALVFVDSPKPVRPDWNKIRIALGCTQAEAEVAADLACGISPTAIAAKRNVSILTVRSQIRTLLEQAGSHRIAELVSFIATTK
jgi:DNA-binding CsgD family transcriptional regulator